MPLVRYGDQYDSTLSAPAIDLARDPLDTKRVDDPSLLSTLGAAFRQENVVGSLYTNKTAGLNRYDPEEGFNPLSEIKGTKYEERAQEAASIFNRPYFEAWKAQVDQEEQDRNTLDSAGWLGTGASAVAAILDLPTLLPGGTVVAGARGGISVARTAATTALAGGVAATAAEGGLQATQELRTAQESAVGIGAGIVFGGLLGGGVGALMNSLQKRAALSAIDTVRNAAREGTSLTPVADQVEQYARDGIAASAGAAVRQLDTLDDLTIAGEGTRRYAASIARLNPVLRALNSPSAAHRRVMTGMLENSVYLKMNMEGRGSAAVETSQKQWERGALGSALEEFRGVYRQARAEGSQLTTEQFNREVSLAMRRGDQSSDPYVQQAARIWRTKVFDPLKQEAIDNGLLPTDVDVTTADSYLTRLWNPRLIEAQEQEFRRIATKDVREQVEAAVQKLTATRDRRLERINAEVADLETPSEQRAALLESLPRELEELRLQNPQNAFTEADLSNLRGELARARQTGDRAAQAELSKRIDQITANAGESYANFVTKRNLIQTRISRLRNNIAGRESQVELLQGRIADVEASNIERLRRLHRSLAILDEDIAKSSPEVWQEKLAKARTQFASVLERSSKAQERLGESRRKAALSNDRLSGLPAEEAKAIVDRSRREASLKRTEFAKIADELSSAEGSFKVYEGSQTQALERAVAKGDAGRANEIENRISARRAKLEEQQQDAYSRMASALDGIEALEGIDTTAVIDALLNRNATRIAQIESRMARSEAAFERAEARRLSQAARYADRIEELEAIDPEEAVAELRRLIETRLEDAAGLVQRETQRMVQIARRLDASDPQRVVDRVAQLRARADAVERDYLDRVEVGLDRQNNYEAYVGEIVDGIYNTLTGRSVTDIPRDIVQSARGPLKERTWNIRDDKVEQFLENDIEMIARRYTRSMSADVELSRKYGSPTMVDQLTEIQNDYKTLRQQIMNGDLPPSQKEKRLKDIAAQERRDLNDLKAVRDLLRGNYRPEDNSTNFARVARAAGQINYLRTMGGVVVSSLTDAVRPAMVHGLRAYMQDGIAPLIRNLNAVKLSAKDAKLAGAISERVLQSRMATMAELTDPYGANTPFERLLDNLANNFTTLTGMSHWNDAQKTIASVMTQNRVLRNIERGMGNLKDRERAYMGYLGLDDDASQRVLAQYRAHGETVDGVYVANTEEWTDDIAKRAYYAAINKDVDATIVTRSIGDVPLFINQPVGRALLQFKSFALASNQKMLMRGMQEGHGRLMGGIAGMTTLGMAVYYFKQMEAGRDVTNNPGTLIAEGLDRSGIFAIGFEINNAVEKAGGPGVYSGLAALGKAVAPGSDAKEPASRFATRGVIDGFLGPTFGLANDVVNTSAIGLRNLSAVSGMGGETGMEPSDVQTIRRLAPYASLPYWRWLIDGGFGFDYGAVPALKEAVQ